MPVVMLVLILKSNKQAILGISFDSIAALMNIAIAAAMFLVGLSMPLKQQKKDKLKNKEAFHNKIKFAGQGKDEELVILLCSKYEKGAIEIAEGRIQTLIFNAEKDEKIASESVPAISILVLILIIIYYKLFLVEPSSIEDLIKIFGLLSFVLVLSKETLYSIFKCLITSSTQGEIFRYKKLLSLLREAQVRQRSTDDL
jgi:hypothetical protein